MANNAGSPNTRAAARRARGWKKHGNGPANSPQTRRKMRFLELYPERCGYKRKVAT